MKSTRYYSSMQEKKIVKNIGGRLQPNSGATAFKKGDVINTNFLIEAKTLTKPQKSFSVKKEVIEKIKQESYAMNRDNYALCFDFGDDERFYIIPERSFREYNRLLDENN